MYNDFDLHFPERINVPTFDNKMGAFNNSGNLKLKKNFHKYFSQRINVPIFF